MLLALFVLQDKYMVLILSYCVRAMIFYFLFLA